VDRLNFSLQFAGSKLGGIKFDAPRLLAAGLLDRPGAPLSLHTSGRAQSIAMTSSEEKSGEEQALSLMETMLLDGQVSEKTNAVIRKELASQQTPPETQPQADQLQIADPTQTLDTMTALILGSPEFQMH
ncbi:MAG: hypothetical protein WA426_01875, partial [Silvibacterium sp.]